MNRMNKVLDKIPGWMASKPSIFIYIFLFFYLVIFALVTYVVPALNSLKPSADAQLILGNYTNVLSALGASIAAGAGTAAHSSVKKLHDKHDSLHQRIEDLHTKIDGLEKAIQKEADIDE